MWTHSQPEKHEPTEQRARHVQDSINVIKNENHGSLIVDLTILVKEKQRKDNHVLQLPNRDPNLRRHFVSLQGSPKVRRGEVATSRSTKKKGSTLVHGARRILFTREPPWCGGILQGFNRIQDMRMAIRSLFWTSMAQGFPSCHEAKCGLQHTSQKLPYQGQCDREY